MGVTILAKNISSYHRNFPAT